ncbi:Lar family restriction alleviation protein [Salmonella enterica]|uniref:Restriction alleviation protein, Lar family n=4 Tax=Salmonella enterica TaxID=28901 RepID=A0A632TZ10_SALER|nr:restriction alleviation protein, Lar family [Salmonella enterica]ECB1914444.1 restriction alleviation protein, Lar family [Salmonella enterica subsp. enterica serovar Newport]EDH0569898.1 restriction alleviation protein, Lar family [Salmonella enterica subsp. arizonae]EEL8117513.1 restriction alleviation protein, Lar family [Salmonella enterica subsp. enterica serovar Poona]OSE58259.1 hypothetical protein R515_12145 [Salmonella enterica subsp. arizonae serovar 41:z4,z23:-]
MRRSHPRCWNQSEGVSMSLPKPCPFCGSGNIETVSHSVGSWFFVYCSECGANGPEENTIVKAALAWNRRAGDEANLSASQRSNQK